MRRPLGRGPATGVSGLTRPGLVCPDDCDRFTTFAGVPLAPFTGLETRARDGDDGQPVDPSTVGVTGTPTPTMTSSAPPSATPASTLAPGSISVLKYDDADGDRVFAIDEDLLPDWTIFIDANGDGTLGD